MERLNKYLAHAGVGSRRHCETLITAGRVKVNGTAVRDLGTRVDPDAHQVSVDDHPVRAEKSVYWVVNKPIGYLCTNDDPAGRPRAVDLLPHVEQRVYVVGRLDEASEGLLFMTNDGDLAFHLMHPRFGVPKTYLVLVAGRPTADDLQKLLDGVWLSDGKVKAKSVRRMKPQGDSTWLRVVLTEGKNREIRRMLAQLGHKVMKLRRVAIGPVTLDKLPRGKARRASAAEVTELQQWVTGAKAKIARLKAKASGKAVPDAGADDEPAPPVKPARPSKPKPAFPPKPRPAEGRRPGPPFAKPGKTGEPGKPGKLAKSGKPAKSGPPRPDRPGPQAGPRPDRDPAERRTWRPGKKRPRRPS